MQLFKKNNTNRAMKPNILVESARSLKDRKGGSPLVSAKRLAVQTPASMVAQNKSGFTDFVDGVGNLSNTLSDGISDIAGAANEFQAPKTESEIGLSKNTLMMIGGAILLVLFFMFKKK